MLAHAFRVAHSIVHERKKDKTRSPHWSTFRKAWVVEHPTCCGCGSTVRPQVHHIASYHEHPDRELDKTNVMTMCMGPNECHLRLAHGDDFEAIVDNIVELAAYVLLRPDMRAVTEQKAKLYRRYAVQND